MNTLGGRSRRSRPVPVEFHIARDARERYDVDEALFSATGNAILPNFAASRRLAQRMNERADPARFGDRVVHAGQLNAMGLIDEIQHGIVDRYREAVNPNVVRDALAYVEGRCGVPDTDATLRAFVERFPTVDAWRGRLSAADWLAGETDGVPNREIALEELLMVWLENVNPAFSPFGDLFDDAPLQPTSYDGVIAGVAAYFGTQPPADSDGLSLIEVLRAPALAVPDSLGGQLRYLRERWGLQLERYLDRLVVNLDVLAEEGTDLARRFGGPGGGPEDPARRAGTAWLAESGWLGTGAGAPEYERFSVDLEWMPSLVLLAKSTYVWLDQLTRTYRRPIERLDQIPDEELDRIARFGFTGLWLIGLWQRSQASQRIKQLRGNPEAVASAYSLDDYRIADDLGGEAAYEQLRDRASARGIRLASDMVPNHMGIDSRWVVEHPDWFISLPEPPYPAYTFTGQDLSADSRVELRIEDHYFDNTDAAVVFQRIDTATGDVRYVYHGNDGTSMPWNDTAQLDYLRADVREAVIQTIIAVARRSPVIRFDAAMTLSAKRHIERLWYPEPGHSGGIPSRAEHALPKAKFEAAMPLEFWREVVDRVAVEAPDTLLLAEAFWLMEGYFVRTLGMHRVYNSAFMNMLRDEQNADYRTVIRNTLEFDPEVLKRYVNFMNNPDEKTAVEQYGKGDKYFGIATVMATLPGLPMFGHGQIEGYAEKYGMEYRRAYWNEAPDPWLVDRHEREIVPLLRRRSLFAHVDEFLLYDFVLDDGTLNGDVYAYSNRRDGSTALIVFHNRYGAVAGRLRKSVPFSARVPDAADGERRSERRTLADGLGLRPDAGWFTVLRDRRAGLETLRSNRELRDEGLRLELGAYDCRVYLDLVEVEERPSQPYGRLAAELAGRAVPSIEAAMRTILLRPIQEPFRRLLGPAALESWRTQLARRRAVDRRRQAEGLKSDLALWIDDLIDAMRAVVGGDAAADQGAAAAVGDAVAAKLARVDGAALETDADLILVVAGVLLRALPGALGTADARAAREWIDAFAIGEVLAEAFRECLDDTAAAWRAVEAVKVLVAPEDTEAAADAAAVVRAWTTDEAAARALAVNVHRGVRWLNREALDQLVRWWALVACAQGRPTDEVATITAVLRAGSSRSGYRFDALEAAVERAASEPLKPRRPAGPAEGA